jgi:hypothetical protein
MRTSCLLVLAPGLWLFRDRHAGTLHITSTPGVIRGTGRKLSGLASNKRWVFLDLVDAT